MRELVPRLQRHRFAVAVSYDVCAWIASYLLFAWLRYDSTAAAVPWVPVLVVAACSALLFLVAAWTVKLHRGRAEVATLEDLVLLGAVMLATGMVVTLLNFAQTWVPRSVPPAAALGALVLAAWARATWRRLRERDDRGPMSADTTPVLVIGAGDAGRALVDSMIRDPQSTWRPVGLLDDDPSKRYRRIRGVPVLGTTHQLAETVGRTGVDTVVIAIPSADSETIARLRQGAREVDVRVKVLPSTAELLSDTVGIRDLRDINLNDVLGRKQIDTDVAAIAGYLTGRRVLVTGAGGSIGSELCRQIHRFGLAELMMLDRDESALHALQLSLHGRALLDSDDVILCDIRDGAALRRIFRERRPEVVFHAAALKHLPMLEQYPAEAVKTNVQGTLNVLDAAEAAGVERFVNISTDKAADPSSVLGYSKRIAECMTASRARRAPGTYLSVRFGNVLGSRGSVLTAFARQIAEGGPVTVTHPEVTRYFMTIEEACQLVVQAAAIGRPGEALVLDMGDPVSIVDVASQLIEQSGSRVAIEFTGLREGEKLHEDLFGSGEPRGVRPAHPMVSHVPVPGLERGAVDDLLAPASADGVREAMEQLCRSVGIDRRAVRLRGA